MRRTNNERERKRKKMEELIRKMPSKYAHAKSNDRIWEKWGRKLRKLIWKLPHICDRMCSSTDFVHDEKTEWKKTTQMRIVSKKCTTNFHTLFFVASKLLNSSYFN